jgi:hypothetical protein
VYCREWYTTLYGYEEAIMANEEHLGILKQGVEVWNQWREENPTISQGLSGAFFYQSALSKAYLVGVLSGRT